MSSYKSVIYDHAEMVYRNLRPGETLAEVAASGGWNAVTVIDNTISDSNQVTLQGRYIVPQTVATTVGNRFTGQSGLFADYNGIDWTFTTPAENTTTLVLSGSNAGTNYKYASGTWSKVNKLTEVGVYVYDSTKAYDANSLALYNGVLYKANDYIPANTAWAIGTTGATWLALQTGTGQVGSYGSYLLVGSSLPASDSPFSLSALSGNLPVVGSTKVLLKAGITYDLQAYLSVSGDYFEYTWKTDAGVTLSTIGWSGSVASADPGTQAPAAAIYTPVADTYVQLVAGVRQGTGQAYVVRSGYGSISIKQVGNSDVSKFLGALNNAYTSANTYPSGTVVTYNGALYLSNDSVPAGTAFTTGTTGATWTLLTKSVKDRIVDLQSGYLCVVALTQSGRLFVMSGSPALPGKAGAINASADYQGIRGLSQQDEVFFIDNATGAQETGTITSFAVNGLCCHVLFDNGNLWAWGRNDKGQLGAGDTTNRYVPVKVQTGVTKLYKNHHTTMGTGRGWIESVFILKNDGYVYATGYNGNYYFDNTTTNRSSFAKVNWIPQNPLNLFKGGNVNGNVVVETNAGLDANGAQLSKILVAGANNNGQMGTTASTNLTTPGVDVTTAWTGSATTTQRIMSVGFGSAYEDSAYNPTGTTVIWFRESYNPTATPDVIKTAGFNVYASLGDGTTTNSATPGTVSIGGSTSYKIKELVTLGNGVMSVYALLENGSLYVWGRNMEGQLGLGTNTNTLTPTLSLSGVQTLGFGGTGGYTNFQYEFCTAMFAQKTDGTWWATGENSTGQQGIGSVDDTNTWKPMRLRKNQTFSKFAVGAAAGSTAGLTVVWLDAATGDLWGWGRTTEGLLGGPVTNHCVFPQKFNWQQELV